jgi:hypothetical protein
MSGAVVKEKGNMSERSQEEDVWVWVWVWGVKFYPNLDAENL